MSPSSNANACTPDYISPFSSVPNKVENLADTNVTESSVFLSWNKPAGNVDFYLIKFQGGKQIKSYREDTEIDSLTPGKRYTFTVLSGVGDNSTWSEETNITAYTSEFISHKTLHK